MDVKKYFEDAAKANKYSFIYGNRASINYSLKLKEIKANERILIMYPCTGRALIDDDGIWSRYEFTTILELCQKSECAGTRASLAETSEQKYNARLQQLSDDLREFMYSVFGCQGKKIQLSVFTWLEMVNQYSEGVDAVQASITFTLWE